MKFRLPIALLFLLSAPLIPAIHAEQITVSTTEELSAAIKAGQLDIQLTDTIYNIAPTTVALPNSPGLTLNGVRDKTIFRSSNGSGTAIAFLGNAFTLNVTNCIFEDFNTHVIANNRLKDDGSIDFNKSSIYSCNFNFVTFKNNRNLVIDPESSQTIRGSAGSVFDTNGAASVADCTFIDNYIKVEGFSNVAKGGAAVMTAKGENALVQRSHFEGNYIETKGDYLAQSSAGALAIPRGIVTDSTFIGNYVKASTNDTTGISKTMAKGGAIGTFIPYYSWQTTIKSCLFEQNYATIEATPGALVMAQGGALYGVFSIQDSDFYYNYTTTANYSQGGAIFASSGYENGGSRALLTVSAVDKDSTFRYNKMGVTQVDPDTGKPLDGIANAIYTFPEILTQNDDGKWYTDSTDNSVFNFKAKAGRSVLFYDPVVLQMGMIMTKPCTQLLELNKADANGSLNEGRIVFTGEDFAETDNAENWTSRFYYNMEARLYNGTLVIKDKAIVGSPNLVEDTFVKPEDGSYDSQIGLKSFTMDKGVLEITGKGHLMARDITISGGHEQTTFRTGTGAVLTGYTVDLSAGVSFDFAPFLDRHDSGLRISASSVTLGGSMGIADSLDHYTDNRWGSSQEYLALSFSTDAAGSLNGTDFSDIISHASGDGNNTVTSPYTYQGYWTKIWKDSDNDGIADQLYGVWTPTEVIKEVQPELAGDATLNSLWSTVSNMEALGSAALGQIGPNRYKLDQCTNYWAQGLGDFDMHRGVNGRDGYDYNGFGYAVGADMRFCPDNWLLGAAFGNLYGKNKSRNFNSEIKQSSYIGMIYGGYYKEYDPINAVNVTASASYGVTTNRLHTYYGDGERSNGKWDNTAMRYTLKGEWVRTLNDHWSLNPFIGLEYDDAKQDSFTEYGDKARRFGKGNLRNLSMPVGVGFWRTDRFENGRIWINGLELSYVPDVYRKNPEAGGERLTNGFSWTAHGVQPSRNAGRAAYNTRVIWDKTWSTFAGYELDFRKNAVYQSVNLGVSSSF